MSFLFDQISTQENKRLDAYLSEMHPDRSRSFFQHLIEKGEVLVNGACIKKGSYKVKLEDHIRILPQTAPKEWTLEKNSEVTFPILYEDSHTLLINKPLGITVHPGEGEESKHASIVHGILALPGIHLSIKDTIRPGIVHRLDKWTSGALLIAKDDRAVDFYSTAFKERTIGKVYLTLVHGQVAQDHGFIEAPIGRSTRDRKKMTIHQGGKAATTEFFVLERIKGFSLLKIILHTGRTHQIRVHLSSIGHPVLGDPTYSNQKNPFPEHLGGQFLHAWKLSFRPLDSTTPIEIVAPLPENFQTVLHELSLHLPE